MRKKTLTSILFFIALLHFAFSSHASYNGPELKMPMQPGGSILCTVEVDGDTMWGGIDTWHEGLYAIDFDNRTSTDPAVAAAGGIVLAAVNKSCNSSDSSCYVTIYHGDCVKTKYLHLVEGSIPSNVSVGETVSSGQKIGTIGNSGKYSKGSHLHFQVYHNNSSNLSLSTLSGIKLDGTKMVDYNAGSRYYSSNDEETCSSTTYPIRMVYMDKSNEEYNGTSYYQESSTSLKSYGPVFQDTGKPSNTYNWYRGNVNNDQWDDLIQITVTGSHTYVYVYRATGTGGFYGKEQWKRTSNPAEKAFVSDFDGDGTVDLILGQQESNGNMTWKRCLSEGTTFTSCEVWATFGNITDEFVIGDYNGDGKAELLRGREGTSKCGTKLRWQRLFNNGSSETYKSSDECWGYSGSQYMAGDVDNNGSDDIIQIRKTSNPVRAYVRHINTSNRTFVETYSSKWGSGKWADDVGGTNGLYYLYDINGDNRLDLIRWSNSGDIRWMQNDGTSFAEQTAQQDLLLGLNSSGNYIRFGDFGNHNITTCSTPNYRDSCFSGTTAAGIGQSPYLDSDGDGASDLVDAFPNDPNEIDDTDGDGIGDNADTDDDNDCYSDNIEDDLDSNPHNAQSKPSDNDSDCNPDSLDNDDDNDGYTDDNDAFPFDASEWQDTDGDGVGDNADADDDGDGIADDDDAFPEDGSEWDDTDGNGIGDNVDNDDDGDGVLDGDDAFPKDSTEWDDTDSDGTGNNEDTDDDNDGVLDEDDAFPLDETEWIDTDGDGVGNNTDTDDDNDGTLDDDDVFPLDDSEWVDTDEDGVGNNTDKDDDDDGVLDEDDAFPLDNTEWDDTDGDEIGNNADTDDDGDGIKDEDDAFPLDETEWLDSDNDGVGDNADPNDNGSEDDENSDESISDISQDENHSGNNGESSGPSLENAYLQSFIGGRAGCQLNTLNKDQNMNSNLPIFIYLLLPLFIFLSIRMKKQRKSVLSMIFLFLLFSHTTAFAQSTGIDGYSIQNFKPQTDSQGIFTVSGTKTLPHLTPHFGFFTNWSHGQFAATTRTGAVQDVIDHSIVGDFLFGLGLWDKINVGLDIPVYFYQSGINFFTGNAFSTTTLGDIRFDLKYCFLKNKSYFPNLAIMYSAELPTGNTYKFTGSQDGTHQFKLIFDKQFKHFYLSGNVGYKFVSQQTVINIDSDDELIFGTGLKIPLTQSKNAFTVLAEINARTVIKNTVEITTPVEVLGGIEKKLNNGIKLSLAGGRGLTSGTGSPLYRVLFGIQFTPNKKKHFHQIVHFDTDQYKITKKQSHEIDTFIQNTKHHKTNTIFIEGHADSRYTEAYNRKLSQKRATSVKNYLLKNSINIKHVTIRSFGESVPIATNTTPEGRALNRRVEIK